MKKMMLVAFASLFMLAACNDESKAAEKSVAENVKTAASAATATPMRTESKKIDFKSIEWAQAIELNKAGGIYLDVRNPDELNTGHAPYAVNIPVGELKNRLNELPKDKDLLVYCRSGRRSEAAAHFLVNNGFERVYNVLGGYLAYPKNN